MSCYSSIFVSSFFCPPIPPSLPTTTFNQHPENRDDERPTIGSDSSPTISAPTTPTPDTTARSDDTRGTPSTRSNPIPLTRVSSIQHRENHTTNTPDDTTTTTPPPSLPNATLSISRQSSKRTLPPTFPPTPTNSTPPTSSPSPTRRVLLPENTHPTNRVSRCFVRTDTTPPSSIPTPPTLSSRVVSKTIIFSIDTLDSSDSQQNEIRGAFRVRMPRVFNEDTERLTTFSELPTSTKRVPSPNEIPSIEIDTRSADPHHSPTSPIPTRPTPTLPTTTRSTHTSPRPQITKPFLFSIPTVLSSPNTIITSKIHSSIPNSPSTPPTLVLVLSLLPTLEPSSLPQTTLLPFPLPHPPPIPLSNLSSLPPSVPPPIQQEEMSKDRSSLHTSPHHRFLLLDTSQSVVEPQFESRLQPHTHSTRLPSRSVCIRSQSPLPPPTLPLPL
ncbi:hypothetical protein BLNAU_5998 [Blattamonas nauphoetae]|uniref:Mucin-2-like n=1 Tax=Blattamonas nauphoetae TaxID=2049346 RepID=A0ABQ9Y5F4_9EUKA|nr:hypothetical protein BLNAU_5998 [Blattamonas nauphoetae]